MNICEEYGRHYCPNWCAYCGGWGTVAVECTCYEAHGGHEMGCPYYGANNFPPGGFEMPCPQCQPRKEAA